MIPFVFVLIFLFSLPTAIRYCSYVSMDKITAFITLSEIFLAKRLIMTYFSVVPSLFFYLILSFTSGLVSLYSSSSLFLFSLSRFLTQPSVSLVESSDSRVLSLVSPMYYSLFLNGGGVFLIMFFFIRYTSLFYPFTWVFWFLNTFFSFDQSFRNFFSFSLARDMLYIWKFGCYTCSRSIHTRNTLTVFSNIYFFWLFYVCTFIRKTG